MDGILGKQGQVWLFYYREMSGRVKSETVEDIIRASKVLVKAKVDSVVLKYAPLSDLKSLKPVTYNDVSFWNLMGGGNLLNKILFGN